MKKNMLLLTRKVLQEGKYYKKESITRRKVWCEEKYYEKESVMIKKHIEKESSIMRRKAI